MKPYQNNHHNQDHQVQDHNHHAQGPLQLALFKAAKVGNFKLMREFIDAGADPFALDAQDCNAIFYAKLQNPEKTSELLKDLAGNSKKRGEQCIKNDLE